MNHIAIGVLKCVRDVLWDWDDKFNQEFPEVWVGVGKPMRRLNDFEKEVAHALVVGAAAAVDHVIGKHEEF